MGWRGLRHRLHAELLRHAVPEVGQGWLVVRVQQHPPEVAETTDIIDSLIHGVLEGPALAEDRVRHDGPGLAVLSDEHCQDLGPLLLRQEAVVHRDLRDPPGPGRTQVPMGRVGQAPPNAVGHQDRKGR